jgi:hypothetical protein
MPNSPQYVPDGGVPGARLPNPQSYDTTTSGVVVDNVTGLMWQHPFESQGRAWSDAKTYCSNLDLAGYRDWRLPTKMELISIVDTSRRAPAINTTVFASTWRSYSSWFWTSTPMPSQAETVWFISGLSGNGGANSQNIQDKLSVRCVRTSARPVNPPSSCYTIENGTVYDLTTKLTWQQRVAPETYTWTKAFEYCATLSLNGGAWRLPTLQELQTIVDDAKLYPPRINETAFPNTPTDHFWTLSRAADSEGSAWRVDFIGWSFPSGAKETYHVRCVR